MTRGASDIVFGVPHTICPSVLENYWLALIMAVFDYCYFALPTLAPTGVLSMLTIVFFFGLWVTRIPRSVEISPGVLESRIIFICHPFYPAPRGIGSIIPQCLLSWSVSWICTKFGWNGSRRSSGLDYVYMQSLDTPLLEKLRVSYPTFSFSGS